ncbi:MAG: response regulator transcription factor [Telmatospirillum sp.]|nr:response regulator transcription factor [Telmatospirillum sp.]
MKILLIEDDSETADYIVQGLEEEGHTVSVANDGRQGLLDGAAEAWDLLIVDRLLPELDGISVVRLLRGSGVEAPMLFLTTLGGIDDRVAGLNVGGDDYLVKPFAFAELVARITALGRRSRRTSPETLLKVADLEVDLLARTVRRAKVAIDLQPREFRLLEYLIRHAGQVVTRTMLLENVWEVHFDPHTNVVESHVSRLRSKIAKGGDSELIHTVRGAGYCLRAPV